MKDATFLNRIGAKLDGRPDTDTLELPIHYYLRLRRTAQEPDNDAVGMLETKTELPVPEARRLLKKGLFFLKQLTLPGVL
jgi:hypothetical protein